ncbi:hypothetical protein [Pseudomonas sp. St316]|uniref:hypothetical protein n=1 Tax=Pseudomonas sp. St316 TaxID=2678257 RepID=UPI001BB3BBEA|nr:hypothetical protein [Pseudomonas sp. St316]BBP56806.1 hypothetical protein PHLH4_03960 [Pseudomonas sp. St316]
MSFELRLIEIDSLQHPWPGFIRRFLFKQQASKRFDSDGKRLLDLLLLIIGTTQRKAVFGDSGTQHPFIDNHDLVQLFIAIEQRVLTH